MISLAEKVVTHFSPSDQVERFRRSWRDRQTTAMTAPASYSEPPAPVFLFDLDGTLIDSVYQHVPTKLTVR